MSLSQYPRLLNNIITNSEKDIDYIVKNGEVLIVDEFTGRIMYGRRYNNGLHQAIEAKDHLIYQIIPAFILLTIYIIVCYPELYMIKFIQLVYSNPIVKLNLSATPLQILGWHQVMGDK